MKRKIVKTALTYTLYLVGCVIFGILVSEGYEIGYKRYSESSRWILSENLYAVKYKNGDIRIVNKTTNKKTMRYDKIITSVCYNYGCYDYLEKIVDESSVIVVSKNDLCGYVSYLTGEEIFKPQFLYAWVDDVNSNLAACVNKNKKLGFVNIKTKEIAIPFQFNFDHRIITFDDYYYIDIDIVFKNGVCKIPDKNGKLGIIDRSGTLLLPIEYDDIIDWDDENATYIILKKEINEDSDHPFVYGACDRNFNIIVPFEFHSFVKYKDESENLKGYIVSIEDKYGILDTLLNETVPLEYDDIWFIPKAYIYRIEQNKKHGLMDNDFNIVVPIEYDDIDFYDYHFKVELDNKYGYYKLLQNGKYETVLPVEYDFIEVAGSEIITLKDGIPKIFNETGKVISTFPINNVEVLYEISEVVYEYGYNDDEYAYYEYDDEPVYIVKKREIHKKSSYFKFYVSNYYCGVVDADFNIIIPAKYTDIEYIGNGFFECSQSYGNIYNTFDDDITFIINSKGKIIGK
jgi:hypothetical protein